MAHVLKRRDQEAVRWYVLTLPTAGGGRDRISPSKGLDAELSRRERRGEALFEYFSPSYVEARKVGGKMVNTRQPLLYNYVFVHASEDEIFRLKRTLPLYNFLPRVSSGGRSVLLAKDEKVEGGPLTPRSAAPMRSRSLGYLCGHHQRSWP